MNLRLIQIFTTKSPLSHISESHSTTSYLVETPILQPNGGVKKVFQYNGNAWRGALRDLSAIYMLEALGNLRVPLPTFHLFFSGGAIGGEQKTDIAAVRKMRETIPHLSLFGGGVCNQIVAGKMRVSSLLPLCAEAIPALPERLQQKAQAVKYSTITHEQDFTRKDDAKDVRLEKYLIPNTDELLKGKKKGATEVSTQMRMTAELVNTGVELYGEIDLMDITEVELGNVTAALHLFGRSPVLGGQSNKGHGRVNLDIRYVNLDNGESGDFMRISSESAPITYAIANSAKAAYDQHAQKLRDQLSSSDKSEVGALLGVQ